jgi:hypothetical protein
MLGDFNTGIDVRSGEQRNMLFQETSHEDREQSPRGVELKACRGGILAPLDSDHSEAINCRPPGARTRVAPT